MRQFGCVVVVGLCSAMIFGCSGSSGGSSTSGSTGTTAGTAGNTNGGNTGNTTGGNTSTTGSNTTGSNTTGSNTTGSTTGTNTSTTGTSTSTTGTTGTTSTSGTTGAACGQATLFAGNPVFGDSSHDPNPNDDPSQRPSDGANILTGIPYLYQELHFSQNQILSNDQLSVWRIDPSTSQLHPVAGDLNASAELLAGPCSSARFADVLGSALGSDGTLYVADWATNAILKITSPLDAANCTVSYLAGTNMEVASSDIMFDAMAGNYGTADGMGAAAQFYGPESMTIDGSNNLYVLDHGTDWSIRKVTTTDGTVSTLATFAADVYPYGQLQYLNGKVYFWAGGNDPQSFQSEAFLIAIDPNATTAVANPAPVLTVTADMVGADSGSEWDIGGITTDGTKLYVSADGQIFSIDVSGSTPKLSGSLAGQNDSTWSVQGNLDFDWADNYDPSAAHAANQVELFALNNLQTTGVYSYLSRDTSGNLYFTAEDTDVYVEKIAGCP